jgi:hypothetical protein
MANIRGFQSNRAAREIVPIETGFSLCIPPKGPIRSELASAEIFRP